MFILNVKNSYLYFLSTLLLSSCIAKPDPEIVVVPEVKLVEIPGTSETKFEIIKVPEFIFIDKSVGIESIPTPIGKASEEIQSLGQAVAKVFNIQGSTGSGFFISEDGLFLTNEHVVPISACINRRCPGFKIVLGFHRGGKIREFTDFEVLAQDNGELDYALLKVKLADGEKVSYLEIQKNSIEFNPSSQTETQVVLGHPGGASLQYANAKAFEVNGASIFFKGIVIPGNSGGPLVDPNTRKVVGLVKSMRTMPSIESASLPYFENTNHATAMWELNSLFQNNANLDLEKVDGSTDLLKLNKSDFESPSISNYESLFWVSSSNFKIAPMLQDFIKQIGTETEKSILEMMIIKPNQSVAKLNLQIANQFLSLSLPLGRPLNISGSSIDALTKELENAPSGFEKSKIKILLNYYDQEKRTLLQSSCLGSLPEQASVLLLAPYQCLSLDRADGKSALSIYAKWLQMMSGYKKLTELNQAFAMIYFSAQLGPSSPDDIEASANINKYIQEKSKDLQTTLQSDGADLGLATGVTGPGSFSETFLK